MNTIQRGFLACFLVISLAAQVSAAGRYLEVSYPPSKEPGELQLGVTYTLWIPDGVTRIRGIIVHQHGCGSGACKGGATAAYDLHWQALAKKWDCALLGPSYHQDDKQNCRLWCDPRNGSHKTFLSAIKEFAVKSKNPELAEVPWCLWGHSGGGFWASLMQTMYPERIVAIWFRSGTAFTAWEKGDITKPNIPESAYQIPMMCNPGAKENGDKRFQGAWTGAMVMFKAYRAKGAPIGFAPDPRTGHECGDSRYLAIPFFDACLGLRLPGKDSKDQNLKLIDMKQAWLADVLSDMAEPASSFKGKANDAVWLPNERVAKDWAEYVKVGSVSDTTPPPAPYNVKVAIKVDQDIEITWDADADFESGLQKFIIQRDGKDLAQVPEKLIGRFGRPLFQTMSYHDTPEKSLPEMRFLDKTATPGTTHEYRVIAVNSVGMKSEPAKLEEAIFEPDAKLKVEAEGGVAGEGPAWHPKLGVLTSGNGHINQLDLAGKSRIYRKGANSNGLLFDAKGRLLACEPGQRRVTRTELDGKITILTADYQGKRYNEPNDLTVDSKGRIYFSDPRYGPKAGKDILDDQGKIIEGVYRIDLDGKVSRILGRELDRPNGVLVSGDDRFLFVADNNNDTKGGARKLWRFDLRKDGNVDLASRKLLFDWGNGRGPDGIKQDQKGRLYVAGGLNKPNPPFEPAKDKPGGIYVFSPDGKLLTFLPVPRDEVTNCAFGGDDLKTLYITGGGTLYSIRTTTPGRVVWPGSRQP